MCSITYIFSIDDFYAIHLAIGPHYLYLRKIYILSNEFYIESVWFGV